MFIAQIFSKLSKNSVLIRNKKG